MKTISPVFVALALVLGCAQAAKDGGGGGTSEPRPVAEGAESKVPPASTPVAAASTPAREPGAALVFDPPKDWVVGTPTSSMRKAQYRLPRVAGDAEDAECVVYFFGDMGGGNVEANIDRWCSQFEQPDGRDSKSVLERSERTVSGMAVHDVKLSGTYVAETAPGSGERVNKPGFELRVAIVASDHGDYFVKLVGPAATVRHHDAAFRDFIGRVH